ncbi:hypothetical protein [Pararhizobium sp.]|uniref:hypothetical protein n=1 Tax=Pararhizobium sp. TaxID=1977563 RepID=UPI002722311B|nr:hypothetical protein [Pararhizobium sp.]MDO9415822.1 hypothetical protein [Pararhizobium sp.]
MENTHLEIFGRILMSAVRDRAIRKYDSSADGKMKSKKALLVADVIQALNEEAQHGVRNVVISTIDNVIFNLLFMIESGEDSINVIISDGYDWSGSLADLSDGLAGEMFGDEGWIEQYSEFRNDGFDDFT